MNPCTSKLIYLCLRVGGVGVVLGTVRGVVAGQRASRATGARSEQSPSTVAMQGSQTDEVLSTRLEEQRDELEALQSMFSEREVEVVHPPADAPHTGTEAELLCRLAESDALGEIPDGEEPREAVIRVVWPPMYPDLDCSGDDACVLRATAESAADGGAESALAEAQAALDAAVASVSEECQGGPVTYALLEHVREHMDELKLVPHRMTEEEKEEAGRSLHEQMLEEAAARGGGDSDDGGGDAAVAPASSATSKKKSKGPAKTKAQKRRDAARLEGGRDGERPRGWDWIDVVSHLRKTGSRADA